MNRSKQTAKNCDLMAWADIGRAIGVSGDYARKIYLRAMAKLRREDLEHFRELVEAQRDAYRESYWERFENSR